MVKLRGWMKKYLGSKPSRIKQSPEQLLFPTSQRRPITPTSFDQPACLFFQLPYDIRSMILLMAFGGRILHLDVERHENEWQWRGAVCGRDISNMLALSQIWNDFCLQSAYMRKNYPKDCNVGIMGFLLSCKQAYTEGIDVLYSANCINIQSEPLHVHLPKFIPPSRLASITSLEIAIRARRDERENGSSASCGHVNHLKPILDQIATHCRHLRRLCLAFLFSPVGSHGEEFHDGPALSWIDAFYHSRPLRMMRIELPYNAYRSAPTDRSIGRHPREAPSKWPIKGSIFEKSLWRSLDGEEPRVQMRATERYPYPPLKLPISRNGDESEESAGYWLTWGDEYHSRPLMCNMP